LNAEKLNCLTRFIDVDIIPSLNLNHILDWEDRSALSANNKKYSDVSCSLLRYLYLLVSGSFLFEYE